MNAERRQQPRYSKQTRVPASLWFVLLGLLVLVIVVLQQQKHPDPGIGSTPVPQGSSVTDDASGTAHDRASSSPVVQRQSPNEAQSEDVGAEEEKRGSGLLVYGLTGNETPMTNAELSAILSAERSAALARRDGALELPTPARRERNHLPTERRKPEPGLLDAMQSRIPASPKRAEVKDRTLIDHSVAAEIGPHREVRPALTPASKANIVSDSGGMPRAKEAPAAKTAAATNRPVYLLQVGAFATSVKADEYRIRVGLLGLASRVEPVEVGDQMLYRVRLGPYSGLDELEAARKKLSNGGVASIPIRAD